MENYEKRGPFYSRGMKAFITAVFLIAIGIFTVAFIFIMGLLKNVNDPELLLRSDVTSYEETAECGRDIVDTIHNLPEIIEAMEPFTTDGEWDPKKTIDITDLKAKGKDKNENTTYTAENIRKMAEEYLEGDFSRLIYDELPFYESDLADDGYAGEITSEFSETVTDTAEKTEESPDNAGNNQWEYSETFKFLYVRGKELEKYLPKSGVTLADYAKENPETVSLQELYENLINICNQYEQYCYGLTVFNEESNLMFAVQNTETGRIFTNVEGWKDGFDPEHLGVVPALYFSAVRENGQLSYDMSNNEAAGYLKNYLKNWIITGSDETVLIVLDSEYPVMDSFYDSHMYFERYTGWGKSAIIGGLLSFLTGIAALALLTIQAGRTTCDRDLHMMGVDRVPTEVMVCMMGLSIVCLCGIPIAYVLETSIYDLFFVTLIVLGEIIFGSLFLVAWMSITRRLKGKRFWKNSFCHAIVQSCKKVYLARQTSGRTILGFTVLVLANILAVLTMGGFGVFLILMADGLVLLYLIREGAGRQVIRDGLARIASGELDFKIDINGLSGENREMAEAVNRVGDGLQNAVKETLKSERLKADLITNVSHDIKTPLTSIINYVDLLKREDIQDPKIRGYIEVLESKSQRLKQLTEDLVEASKVSSGNVVLDMQPIQLGELVRQTNGEFEEKFAARSLELICRVPEEPVVIFADGRRMWRVIENLYNNVAKYAMPSTRVYVEVKKIGCRVIFEIKNISEHPLNIKAEELTERFIRGDVSRSTEGSGLGLSIAQDLVKMQNGTFDIYLDGDLFKVTITFEDGKIKQVAV